MSQTLFESELLHTNQPMKLLPLPSSNSELLNALHQMEGLLSEVQRSSSESTIKALKPIISALIDKKLVRHPDMDVNISVSSCICEIMRIMAPGFPYTNEQMKEFLELVVMTFEKLSFTSGGWYTRMTKILDIFINLKLPVLMSDLQLDKLAVRLFKQFLDAAAGSNSPAVVSKMEEFMTMIIEKSEPPDPELVDLLVTAVRKYNTTHSLHLAENVIDRCADQLRPHLPHMKTQDNSPVSAMSVTNVNGKRRRDEPLQKMKRAQSVKNGKNLEGRRIKVLWPDDNLYYPGVVKRFDYITKRHKILYNDGDQEILDLNQEQWEFLAMSDSDPLPTTRITSSQQVPPVTPSQQVQPVTPVTPSAPATEPLSFPHADLDELLAEQQLPRKTSISQCSMICVQNYKVKESFAPILEAIFKKQGDIAAQCIFTIASVRASLLEVVCEAVMQIEANDVIEKMEEIESHVSQVEAVKIDVSWLRVHLEDIYKRKDVMKKLELSYETKVNTVLVQIAAQMDLTEKCAELVTAQERFQKAERCVRVLHLVEKKLNKDILDSKTEKDLWRRQTMF